MSGIYDRIVRGAVDRLPVHFLRASMHLSVQGVFTAQQLLDKMNGHLVTPLDAQAVSDLSAVRSAIVALTGNARQVALETFDAMNMAAEAGDVAEGLYRSTLGID